ncbi:hypothetical protein PLESTB_001145500 [Pleodorina starrii]|uniref:Vacuolar protein-sorting-associated protein 36 n=1 Tax=Pleodorina starrii TaxID=330485 RepID=A0A9W6BQX6_9CHLO|nr:hypothetical protein PLESTM_000558800 [Pleodorina starrii]GLC56786.1 hypothetical protein PLESTB_001145500 [Pleodorina starrii]GLC66938.1 hypothetical protein PLESTF_000492400 [Pleodorina starrii]
MILTAAQLTPSGRPVLQQGEVEVSLLDKVDLEFQPVGGLPGQQAEAYKNGYAILTTRRLIWVDAGPTDGAAASAPAAAAPGAAVRAASLPLSSVVVCHKRVQFSIKGAKVRLVLEVYTDPQRQPMPASGFHTHVDLLALRCRGPAPDTFKQQLEEQTRQAIAADAAAAPPPTTTAGAAAAAAAAAAVSASSSFSAFAGGQQPLPDPRLSPLRAALQAKLSPRASAGSPTGGLAGAAVAAAATATAAAAAAGSAAAAAVAAAAAAAQSPVLEQARPDPAMLQCMVEMGFPRNRAARSLLATANLGAQEAIDYLLAFGDQPGMDDPLDQPTPGWGQGPPPPPPPPPVQGPAWAAATSPPPASSAHYPAVLPASAAMPGSPALTPAAAAAAAAAGRTTYPSVPQLDAAAVTSPYGGAASGGPSSPATFGTGGGGSPAAALQQRMAALRPYAHQYGSAPELAGASAGGAGGGLDLAGLAPRTIGVAGIVKREQQKTEESGRAVEQAFRDLSALMSSAAAMVALAEKFRGVMAADGSGGGGVGGVGGGGGVVGGEDPLLMDLETQQQLISLGISSPVTRESAGARYHIELCRQLADFLHLPLQRCGGLISLPDVYCLFNRARGTELVSPDDLLQAAKLFGRAGVAGLRLRPLSSGVLVIQGPQHSEEQVCAKIAQLTTPPPTTATTTTATTTAATADATTTTTTTSPSAPGAPPPPSPPPSPPPGPPSPPLLGPGLTSSDVALALGGISVAIAAEHLLTAEARGVVCRDDGPEGLRFYRNFFVQDRLETAALFVRGG